MLAMWKPTSKTVAASTKRFRPKSLPEFGVASSKIRFVFRKRLTGRLRPAQTGLWLGVVSHVAFAAFLFEDVSRDVVDFLELPGLVGTEWPGYPGETIGISKGCLIDVSPPRYQPAPEILEAVIGAATVNDISCPPEVPGVSLIRA
jgi:hypothetical protein